MDSKKCGFFFCILDEVLQDCTLPKHAFIIGTLNPHGQTAQTPTNLQIHHNFRFVQLTTHTEPLRGLVGRFLRQKLLNIETKTRMLDGEMAAAVDWVARIHLHLNRILGMISHKKSLKSRSSKKLEVRGQKAVWF